MTQRQICLTLSTLVLAGCGGRAREVSPPEPSPQPSAPGPASTTEPTEPLPPGTYEPFEPPPAQRDSQRTPDRGEGIQPGAARSENVADPTPAARAGDYVIQIAAFAQREPAEDLADLLGRRYGDYPIRVVPSAGLFRVWLGGWASRDDAAPVLVIVRQRYPDAWIVTP